jgi:hypothetical protein
MFLNEVLLSYPAAEREDERWNGNGKIGERVEAHACCCGKMEIYWIRILIMPALCMLLVILVLFRIIPVSFFPLNI